MMSRRATWLEGRAFEHIENAQFLNDTNAPDPQNGSRQRGSERLAAGAVTGEEAGEWLRPPVMEFPPCPISAQVLAKAPTTRPDQGAA